MTDRAQEANEAIQQAVQRHAMEVLEAEPHEHEARYALFRAAYFSAARDGGATEQEASEFADAIDRYIRGMVAAMETSGGAKGGRA